MFLDSAPHIQEVGGFTFMQFDNVHSSHCQACTIDWREEGREGEGVGGEGGRGV